MRLYDTVTLLASYRGYPIGTSCTIVDLPADGGATVEVADDILREDDEFGCFDVRIEDLRADSTAAADAA